MSHSGLYHTSAQGHVSPNGKANKKPPRMLRLPPRPYDEPQHHNTREWVGQLHLAMVAQFIPNKQVDSMYRKGIFGGDAIMAEWADLMSRRGWDTNRAKPL